MRKRLGPAVMLGAVLLLTSCATADDIADAGADPTETADTTETTQTTEPPPTTETTPPPTTESTTPPPTTQSPEPEVAPQPKVGNCYATGKPAFQRQRDGTTPVSCAKPHTAETFAVFKVSEFPTTAELDSVWRRCQPRFVEYVGDTATVSTLGLTVIEPSYEQEEAGQSWARCDALEMVNYNGRGGISRTGSLENALENEVPPQFRGCVKRWPKVTQAVHFTSCQQRHQAELIPESINLGGPNAEFIGEATAAARSKEFCSGVFQDYVPETNNYYYYYPTATSWSSGSHDTTCWALDTTGDNLPPL